MFVNETNYPPEYSPNHPKNKVSGESEGHIEAILNKLALLHYTPVTGEAKAKAYEEATQTLDQLIREAEIKARISTAQFFELSPHSTELKTLLREYIELQERDLKELKQ